MTKEEYLQQIADLTAKFNLEEENLDKQVAAYISIEDFSVSPTVTDQYEYVKLIGYNSKPRMQETDFVVIFHNNENEE